MNKQKLVVLLTISILVICTALAWDEVIGNETKIKPSSFAGSGRYQLFQGQYPVSTKTVPFNEIGVFKIDTETGNVWLYREGQTKEGESYKKWEVIGD